MASLFDQNEPNAPSTTASLLRFPSNDLVQPQGYYPPQRKFPSSESHSPPSDITIPDPLPNPTYNPKPLPPDVAAARLTRINRDLITACRNNPSLRHDQPAILRGNGTYTHIASPNIQDCNEPTLLPLGGPRGYQQERRLEPELPEEVNRAYDILQKMLREEERLAAMGDTTDPRIKYSALPKPPTTMPKLPPPPPPPPPSSGQYNAEFAPPPPPILPMVDTQMGGMGSGLGSETMNSGGSAGGIDGASKSATATMVDVSRDPRLKRRAADGVYGRR
jgi:hypothetical protein